MRSIRTKLITVFWAWWYLTRWDAQERNFSKSWLIKSLDECVDEWATQMCAISLSVLVLHSYRCRIKLLLEFPNEHPFMQKVLISKANSMKAFIGVSKQEICITCLATNIFRIHKMFLVFSHCLAVPGWCVSPLPPHTLPVLHIGPTFLAHLSSFGLPYTPKPPPVPQYKIKQNKTANEN